MSAHSCVKLVAVALLCLAGCASRPVRETRLDLQSLPRYSNIHPYKLEPFVPVAISLQKLGPERGSQALLNAAGTAKDEDYEKIVVLCRMLFKFRESKDSIYPSLGERVFIGGTTYAEWPLEPIELVDGYPFWIVRGFNGGGARSPNAAARYVSYCISNCEWNTFKFRMLSKRQKHVALEKLINSAKWKRPLSGEEEDILTAEVGPDYTEVPLIRE